MEVHAICHRCSINVLGIYSGYWPSFQNVPTGPADYPVFVIKVEVPGSQWFYSGQERDCQNGFLFAINPGVGFHTLNFV